MAGNVYKGTDWETPEGWVATERQWFKLAVEALGDIVMSDIYIDSITGVPVVTISKAIYKDSKMNGVVAIDFYLTELTDIISQSKSNDSNISFLVTDDGKFVVNTAYEVGSRITEVKNGSLKDFSV